MKYPLQIIATFFFLFLAGFSEAYIGPGAGVSAIGTALAFVVIVLLLIVGFLWYPIKTFLGNKKEKQNAAEKTADNNDSDSDEATGL